MLLLKHCLCCLLHRLVLPSSHTVMLRCVFTQEFSPNSLLLQTTRELVGKVLLFDIKPKPLDLSSGFPFSKALHLQETGEYFSLHDQARPSVSSVVIDEGYKITASFDAHVLCRSHTSQWIKSSLFRLRFRSLGNGSRCCFLTRRLRRFGRSDH